MKTPVNYTLIAPALLALSTLNSAKRRAVAWRRRINPNQLDAMKTFVVVLALFSLAATVLAQGTAFTYQGQLQNNGSPASGTYNLTFSLFNTNTGGVATAGPVTNNAVAVSNGLFAVLIDFGPGVFTGATNWLEIALETNGAGSFTTLAPRQQLTPAPYAIFAEGANAAGLSGAIPMASLSGTYGTAVNLTNAGNSFSGNGAGLTGVNAATLGGLASSNFWQTAGNAGTSPTNGNFLGTTDNQPLELHAGGLRALRLEPDPRPVPEADNLIGGFTNNLIQQPGSGGDVIVGGGYDAGVNIVLSNSAGVFIGAGSANQIGPNVNDAFIGAGYGNTIQAPDTVVGGGSYNTIQSNAYYSTIGGGNSGNIGSPYATISGGGLNSIGTNSNSGTISGGYSHTIRANTYDATIGGGSYHTIGTNSYYSTIAGGRINSIGDNATASTIGGGFENTVANNATYATIPGGYYNSAAGQYSFAAGNQAQANHAGAFVWADSESAPFASSTTNQFSVRANGGVQFVTGGAGMTLDGQGVVPSGNYVFAYSSGAQTVASANVFQDITFSTDAQINGWMHTPGASQYTNAQSGLYLIQYSVQASSTTVSGTNVQAQATLNSVAISGSRSAVSFNALTQIGAVSRSIIASVNNSDVLTIQFTGSSTSVRLSGSPGVALTITRIQ